jgi:hypothetical protein
MTLSNLRPRPRVFGSGLIFVSRARRASDLRARALAGQILLEASGLKFPPRSSLKVLLDLVLVILQVPKRASVSLKHCFGVRGGLL